MIVVIVMGGWSGCDKRFCHFLRAMVLILSSLDTVIHMSALNSSKDITEIRPPLVLRMSKSLEMDGKMGRVPTQKILWVLFHEAERCSPWRGVVAR
jgi:hypothetical protein